MAGICFSSARDCNAILLSYDRPVAMKKFLTVLAAAAVAYFGFSAAAEAGRRSRSDVPPPVVIDRTVFTPVVSGL